MTYYAIQNKDTGRYVVRTMKLHGISVQITEHDGAKMYATREQAEDDMKRRQCDERFEVVEL